MEQESKPLGITFNGHHSDDFYLLMTEDKKITFPSKKKIKQELTGSNNVIDLSMMFGSPLYADRTFVAPFEFDERVSQTPQSLYRAWTNAVNWLMGPNRRIPLVDDVDPEYHYLAEVEEAPSFEEYLALGELDVTFVCYPFRIRNHIDYDDSFDYFIEHEDYLAQEVHYKVGGLAKGTLINIGVSEVPITVTASAAATLTVNGQPFTLSAGDNTDLDLVLAPGDNALTLTGDTGTTADFSWHQEVI